MSENQPIVRENEGRFAKGHSGNPNGRPPNTKNKLAALRKELELALIEHVGEERLKRIIIKVADMAEGGNLRAAKLILDKVVSNAGPGEDEVNPGRTVVFRIENATFAATQASTASLATQHQIEPTNTPIDVEVTDVTDKQEITK